MMSTTFIFAAAALISSTPAPESGSVRGFIFAADGTGIPGARIRVAERELVTDREGSFVCELPPGDYAFMIDAPGHPEVVSSKIPVLPGQESEFMIVFHGEREFEVEMEIPQDALVDD